MTTTITGKNQITIPASIAAAYRLKPGMRIDWIPGDSPHEIRCRIVPDPATLARELRGAGRKHLRATTENPIHALIRERAEDGKLRDKAL